MELNAVDLAVDAPSRVSGWGGWVRDYMGYGARVGAFDDRGIMVIHMCIILACVNSLLGYIIIIETRTVMCLHYIWVAYLLSRITLVLETQSLSFIRGFRCLTLPATLLSVLVCTYM